MKNNYLKITLLMVTMLMITMTSVTAIPLTLYGEKAECDVYPSRTVTVSEGQKVNIKQDNTLFNVYKENSYGGWDFLDEYKEKVRFTAEYQTMHIEVYGNCDFSKTTWGDWIFENCPEGYADDGVGNCIASEEQLEKNRRFHCEEELQNYWYDDQCNEEKAPFMKGVSEKMSRTTDGLSLNGGVIMNAFIIALVIGLLVFMFVKAPMATLFLILGLVFLASILLIFFFPMLAPLLAINEVSSFFGGLL